ncbi:MAG: glycoside hydrolase family 38 C-terminal domain-containing protein, partial [Planctomycetota bacterium]
FSEGCNNTRAVTFNRMYAKSPCWWEGPDGSRVLMVWVPSYAYAARWGLQSSMDEARERVMAELTELEQRDDYPYDAVFLNGAVSDNQPLSAALAAVARAWNERYAFPRIVLCHNAEFFEYVEKQWGDKLPVVRGSGGAYWEDGAASSARETALNRNAHELLVNGEKLLALGAAAGAVPDYPRARLAEAWRNVLLFDEHTWGAHCSVSQPQSPQTRTQWAIKQRFAERAHHLARGLMAEGLSAVRGLVRAERGDTVVVNPMSWSRTDVVEMTAPGGASAATGAPSNVVETRYVLARDVPACGYRVLSGDDARGVRAEALGDGSTIESRYYRVTVDPKTGAIASVWDRELKEELVDQEAAYGANQYLRVTGGEASRIVRGRGRAPKLQVATTGKASLRRQRIGDLGQRIVVGTDGEMTPDVVTEITVWNHLKRVDIENLVRKRETTAKEAVYFAFPFAVDRPTVRYEEPLAVVDPSKDMLPGACQEWHAVQHFVQLAGGKAAITWATPDAPLVCLGDINRGTWRTETDLRKGHLYAYVQNNYWFTNYRASQGGQVTFRFALTSARRGEVVTAARFGWGMASPLAGALADSQGKGRLRERAGSLAEVAEPNVLLVAAKRPALGTGLVLRLWEVAGQAATAHVRLPLTEATKATLCNLVEEPERPLPLRERTVAVPVRARGVATVRVQ